MTDSKNILECPACGKIMKKIFIEDAGINIDICSDGCGGIYFENREFEKIESTNIDDILNEVKDKNFTNTDEREVRLCPRCNVGMVKMGSGIKDVQIDVCNTCGAKFLDNGELQKIREGKINNNNVDALVEELYKKEAKEILGNNLGKEPLTKGVRVALEKWIFRNLIR